MKVISFIRIVLTIHFFFWSVFIQIYNAINFLIEPKMAHIVRRQQSPILILAHFMRTHCVVVVVTANIWIQKEKKLDSIQSYEERTNKQRNYGRIRQMHVRHVNWKCQRNRQLWVVAASRWSWSSSKVAHTRESIYRSGNWAGVVNFCWIFRF